MSSHKSNNQILNNLFFQLCAINILINMKSMNKKTKTVLTDSEGIAKIKITGISI